MAFLPHERNSTSDNTLRFSLAFYDSSPAGEELLGGVCGIMWAYKIQHHAFSNHSKVSLLEDRILF